MNRRAFALSSLAFVATLALGLAAVAQYPGSSPSVPSLDVPYVPTPNEVVDRMLLLAKVGPQDTVYDLGSGDGRLVVTAAQRFGAQALGVDLDPARIAEGRGNAAQAGVADRVRFHQGDLFEVDLRPATVLTLYLLGEVNIKLRPRILRDLRPGARVVSHDFDMNEWQPDDVAKVGEHTVYLWVVPAALAGTMHWELPEAEGMRRYTMKLDQQFQKLKGKVKAAGSNGNGRARLIAPQVRGDQMAFTIVEGGNQVERTTRYTGTVNGDNVEGVARAEAGGSSVEVPWRATLQRRR